MEITTNEREAWIPLAERESASESRSLQSHRSRESLFECDEEPFQLWLRRIVPDSSRPTIDGESMDSKPSETEKPRDIYWRADLPHAVVSRSPVDQTGDCTEPLLRTDQRSLFGRCAPLPLVGDARPEEPRSLDCLTESADGWKAEGCYDEAIASREDAVRILQLLEYHQSQWLTTPELVHLLPLPRLPGSPEF
ncbi:hypothetical protein [Pirellula sp. SH-Sr6A]|uniref:hypothetical protein n=1 Tax=Pirellula sp. SH-Sr6A TaxID=1632865 RepID=UPI0011BAB3D2|nr:hypothetical protein [Pirellula sp. SH-Sr6A]